MNTNRVRTILVLGVALMLALAPLRAHAACSTAFTAGSWAYTYIGTIFTQNGPVPAVSVGRFRQDAAGNINGSQTRSVGGQSGTEDISGTVSVNGDCTGSATIGVYVNGQLQRTASLALVYDSNENHLRGMFQSLTLPDGTNVPVTLSIDGNRIVLKD